MMLLVLLVAVLLGREVNQARRQRDAVAAIRRYGGWVHYDYEFVKGKLTPGREPRAPKWLRRYLGDEYFQDVYQVNLIYEEPTPGPGKRQDNLHTTDDVAVHLESFPRLRELLLYQGQATDEAMKHVGTLAGLEGLWMWDAKVSDAGVARLKGLRNLKQVHISNSKMTDEGLSYLGGLPRVEELTLQGNRFTDRGLASLAGRTNLKCLCVGVVETDITDAGMDHLKGLSNLEVLGISQTKVTDQGLSKLRGLTKLKTLWIVGSRVSKVGAAKFQAAMPNLKRVW